MDRFTTFRSTFEALKAFPAEDMKRAYVMMGEYAMDGVLPEPENTAAYGLFCSIRPLIDASVKRSEAGRAGGKQTGSKPQANCKQNEANRKQTASNPEAKIKDKRENEKETLSSESVKKKRDRFFPPTIEQVREYVTEKGYNVDAERFVDFYESKNWMVGKNKMADWKAAVRNWARSQRQEKTAEGRQEKTVNRFNNFPQRDYDFADLERQLLGVR